MINSDNTKKLVDELNHKKKMQDLDMQIKIAEAKQLDEYAKKQEKESAGGVMQYMNTPEGSYPMIQPQGQR